ncbi:TraB/GumN family protein [Silvimonas iriomotensis]|uniref:TraB/GumN family protein n=1 Tax=Silvimonas iriomotensis TaxID=449662 RepID=A0ABQ2P8W1_9NEIS|nr:TraB/GumN family protein [Silvimonas iriomotensis]GGP20791.1 hypothetical protein GCM10010970_16970 [Silvimonas iriomotensis]
MLARLCLRLVAAALTLAAFLPQVAQAASDKAQTFPHAIFWRIDKPGAPSSWLFGTAHVADPRVTTLSAPVQKAFDSSDQVYTEIRIDLNMMMDMARAVLRPEGDLLSAHIDDAHYQKLLPELNAREYPEVATRRLYIWAAAMLMMEPKKQPGQLPLDLLLAKMSVEGGKNYNGLETIQEQLSLFQNMPEDKQRAMLYSMLDHPDEYAMQTRQIIDAYVARDLTRIMDVSSQDDPNMSSADQAWFRTWARKDLLTDRNVRFAERLQAPLAKGNAFIAVGAMHLPGPQGLVALLKKAGYTLAPIYDAAPASTK